MNVSSYTSRYACHVPYVTCMYMYLNMYDVCHVYDAGGVPVPHTVATGYVLVPGNVCTVYLPPINEGWFKYLPSTCTCTPPAYTIPFELTNSLMYFAEALLHTCIFTTWSMLQLFPRR